MTKLILIAAGETDWRVQGRLSGDTDLPLNARGQAYAAKCAGEVAALAPVAIRSAPEQAARQTASIIARSLGLRSRVIEALRELDLGLWEGLTMDDLAQRFAKAYRQWRSDARSVEPPEGEAVLDAAARLLAGLQRLLRRHKDECVALVVEQFAAAILRCNLQLGGYDGFWGIVEAEPAWHAFDVPQLGALSAAPTKTSA